MKYLSRISVPDDRQQQQQQHQQLPEGRPQLSSTAQTAKLYSITFLESQPTPWLPPKELEVDVVAYSDDRVSFITKQDIVSHHRQPNFASEPQKRRPRQQYQHRNKQPLQTKSEISTGSSFTTTTTSFCPATTKASLSDCANQSADIDQTSVDDTDFDDDWILIEPHSVSAASKRNEPPKVSRVAFARDLVVGQTIGKHQSAALEHMALDNNDVATIKASWVSVRQNPRAAGVLLFKGLFTKFPKYLSFFPQFADLDIERMEENGRLLSHAVKVINTVSFLVDSIGDESKAATLNEALVKLVRSHLRKKVGLAEFRNLGIVLIDFICEYNNRRGEDQAASTADQSDQSNQSPIHSGTKSGGGASSSSTSTDSNSSIVAAWTKLYSVILDLVRSEEAEGWTTA